MKLPNRALYDYEINHFVNKLKVPYFRGVFMLDTLPRKPNHNESAVVNLDSNKNPGTHWVAYKKRGNYVEYFDSFGNLKPPKELVNYFEGGGGGGKTIKIFYNRDQYQKFNTINCGHLCIEFLTYKSS